MTTTAKKELNTLTLGRAEEVKSGDLLRTLNELRRLWDKAAAQANHENRDGCDKYCGTWQEYHFSECKSCPTRDIAARLIDEYLNN